MSVHRSGNALQKVCGSLPLSPRHCYRPNVPGSAATAEQCPPRVTAIIDGTVKVLGTEPPEFSSAATRWSGFLLERHSLEGAFEEIGWHSSHVIMCLGGSSVVRVTGGAGDAFTAALTHYYLRAAPLSRLNAAGNRWGAWVASHSGAMPALPDAEREAVKQQIAG